jgi:RNA polymerase sigma factor (sigma-70 family)
MNTGDDIWVTRQTLIQRAKNPNDTLAWHDFDNYYRSFIEVVIKKFNLPICDREDLAQDVLLKVWKSLESMNLNKNNAKFRTWLSTIIKNTVIDFFKKEKGKNKNLSIEDNTIEITIPSDIDKLIEEQWQSHLSKLAFNRISKNFSGNAIEAFKLSYSGHSTEEISNLLNLSTDSVYVLKNRVKNKLIEELKQLQKEIEFE